MAGPGHGQWAFGAEGASVESSFATVVGALEAAKQHTLASLQRVSRCLAASEDANAELSARALRAEQEAALATGQLAAVTRRCDDLLEEAAVVSVERDRERVQFRGQIEQERAETRRALEELAGVRAALDDERRRAASAQEAAAVAVSLQEGEQAGRLRAEAQLEVVATASREYKQKYEYYKGLYTPFFEERLRERRERERLLGEAGVGGERSAPPFPRPPLPAAAAAQLPHAQALAVTPSPANGTGVSPPRGLPAQPPPQPLPPPPQPLPPPPPPPPPPGVVDETLASVCGELGEMSPAPSPAAAPQPLQGGWHQPQRAAAAAFREAYPPESDETRFVPPQPLPPPVEQPSPPRQFPLAARAAAPSLLPPSAVVGRWTAKQQPLDNGFLVDRAPPPLRVATSPPSKRPRYPSPPPLVSPPVVPGGTRWAVEPRQPERQRGEAEPPGQRPPPRPTVEGERDVERRKAVRQEMPAFECVECKRYYDAAADVYGAQRRGPCNHASDRAEAAGRHRGYEPAYTPEGFWNLGFDPTPKPRA